MIYSTIKTTFASRCVNWLIFTYKPNNSNYVIKLFAAADGNLLLAYPINFGIPFWILYKAEPAAVMRTIEINFYYLGDALQGLLIFLKFPQKYLDAFWPIWRV